MGMMAYAAVPLYEVFCRVTGYGGTTQVATATAGEVLDREMVIRFNADMDPELPWSFHPEQREVRLKVVEQGLARSEEHTSELQALMRISYAVFCLNKQQSTLKHTQKSLH